MMVEKGSAHGRLWGGMLFGAALGLVMGLLFAPKSGKEMRHEISEKGRHAIKDAKELSMDAGAKVKKILDEGSHQATELKKDVERHYSEARQKTKEILSSGEKVMEH